MRKKVLVSDLKIGYAFFMTSKSSKCYHLHFYQNNFWAHRPLDDVKKEVIIMWCATYVWVHVPIKTVTQLTLDL